MGTPLFVSTHTYISLIMAITLYHNDISPPSRAVWAVLKQIGIEFDVKKLDLLTQEHKQEWYLKINPIGQVPFLTDCDFSMPESRAIMCYLIDQYADKSKFDYLYPAILKPEQKSIHCYSGQCHTIRH